MKKNEIVFWGHHFRDDAIKKAVFFRPTSKDGEVEVRLYEKSGKFIKTIKESNDGEQK